MRHIVFAVVVGVAVGPAFGCSDPGPDGPIDRELEGLVIAEDPPPAIQGGTLLVASDNRTALASDVDRDVIWAVDIDRGEILGSVPLAAGARPGRIVETPDGFFVVLTGDDAIVHIDRDTLTSDYRRPVCESPQGIDYDPGRDELIVACSGGELLTLEAVGGALVRQQVLDHDLRDVVVSGGHVYVSRFRSAEVLVLDGDSGELMQKITPPAPQGESPGVAWRMVEAQTSSGVLVVHQRAKTDGEPVVVSQPGGYGGGGFECVSSIVETSVSRVAADQQPSTALMTGMVLPVDLAVRDNQVAVAAAGNRNDEQTFQPAVGSVDLAALQVAPPPSAGVPDPSFSGGEGDSFGGRAFPGGGGCFGSFGGVSEQFQDGRQAIAVAFANDGRLVMQTRDPWEIVVSRGVTIRLPGEDRKDSGHDLFHENAGAGLACASCHPGGQDDGQTWNFESIGLRRTQNIAGGIMGSEPFHWSGDMANFQMLVDEVFSERMSGPRLPADYAGAMAGWIDTIPAPPHVAVQDPTAIDRGRALFESAEVGCADCHNGSRFSNDLTVDVGTGEPLQVPSLIGVGMRYPLMHDGCAQNLHERFDPACGGGDRHGVTSHLTPAEIDDLVSYLNTI